MPIIPALKAARLAQGRTVREVAQTAGLPPRTLYSAERASNATAATLEAWAAALGLQIIVISQDADISSAKGAA